MTSTHVDQVGDTHYAQSALAHWDVCETWDVDGLSWNGTKYLMRWRKKGVPRLDLEKAASYFEKMLKCRQGMIFIVPRLVPLEVVNGMCHAGGVDDETAALIRLILCHGERTGVEKAMQKCRLWAQEIEA